MIRQGETMEVEFKGESSERLSDGKLVEAVVCLANRKGLDPAWLLVGVEDDGTVSGAQPRHGKVTDMGKLAAMIEARTVPNVEATVHEVSVDSKPVLAIEVPVMRQLVCTSDGRYVRRARMWNGPTCVPMPVNDMLSLLGDRRLVDHSAEVIPDAKWEDLDHYEFERFRRSVRERKVSDKLLADLDDFGLAKALGVIDANGETRGVRLAALLLFGQPDVLRSLVPTHEVAFQVLRGMKVEQNDFVRHPLLRVLEEFDARVHAANREQEVMVGLVRRGIPNYAEHALREALANALVHRDYYRRGAIHVQWEEDRVLISNPGGFPEGVGLENLLVTGPRPRNPLLADALKRAGVVERRAHGIRSVFHDLMLDGRPPPSYGRSDYMTVFADLPIKQAKPNFVRVTFAAIQQGHSIGLDELLILHRLLAEGRLGLADASRLLQRGSQEARAAMGNLVAAGIAKASSRRSEWELSEFAIDALGDEVGKNARTGDVVAADGQAVLRHVAEHGRITRREVAETCRVTSVQARQLLSGLVESGALEMRGVKRGAFYVSAAKG